MGTNIDDAPSVQEWSDYISMWICKNNSSFFTFTLGEDTASLGCTLDE